MCKVNELAVWILQEHMKADYALSKFELDVTQYEYDKESFKSSHYAERYIGLRNYFQQSKHNSDWIEAYKELVNNGWLTPHPHPIYQPQFHQYKYNIMPMRNEFLKTNLPPEPSADLKKGYDMFKKTSEWKAMSDDCIIKANMQCEKCGSSDQLVAHHLEYTGDFYKDKLQCLCGKCHKEEHERLV